MDRKNLLNDLASYATSSCITAEEKPYLERFLTFIAENPACFERSNSGHITSSVWIINHEKTHALLTHHKKFNLWVQLGGHNDGDADCKATALKEAEEESGITGFTFLTPSIFDIDIHAIPTACLYHYDVRYLLQTPPGATYSVSDESHDLAWVPLEKIREYSKERSVLRLAEKCASLL